MSPTSSRNWCISREVPFDQVGTPCQIGSRHGSAGPGAGCDTPSRPSRLHAPAHRPSGLVATPPAFQGFVDPSITVGLFGVVEEIRHKNGEFFTALCGFPTYPCCARRNSLNATPPGSGTSNGSGSCLLRGGCTRIVFLSRFLREVGWPGNRGSRAPTEPYVTVSRHTALVVLVSPHGTRFSDPCPVHEIIRRFLDACVPFAHGFGPADP